MKAQIHENKKSKLQNLSKKLVMLAVAVLGTTTMVNAQTTPTQTATLKEVKVAKHDKKGHKKAKADKKAETETAKPEAAKTKK